MHVQGRCRDVVISVRPTRASHRSKSRKEKAVTRLEAKHLEGWDQQIRYKGKQDWQLLQHSEKGAHVALREIISDAEGGIN